MPKTFNSKKRKGRYNIMNMTKQFTEEQLGRLTDRERRVLELRHGIKDGETKTLEQVGHEFGVTRERIRQIETKATRQMVLNIMRDLRLCLKQ